MKRRRLSFDVKTFLRIVFSYLIVILIWIFFGMLSDNHPERGLLFNAAASVTIFAFSFIFGLKVQNIKKTGVLWLSFLSTFAFAFFINTVVMINFQHSLLVGGLLTTVTASFILAKTLNKIRKIDFLYLCILVTALVALPACFLPGRFTNRLYAGYGLSEEMARLIALQSLAIVPLSLGLSIRSQPKGDSFRIA